MKTGYISLPKTTCKRIWVHSFRSSVQFSCSVVSWIAAHQASLSITDSRSVLKLMSIESVMPTSHLIICHPLLLLLLLASVSFPMSQLYALAGQSIWVSASASVLPMNTQDWSPLGWTGWIPLQSKGLSRVFYKTAVEKHLFFSTQLLHSPTFTSIYDHWKTIALIRRTFVGKVMSLLFNMLSRLVITSLSRSKCLLISWLQSPSAVILWP